MVFLGGTWCSQSPPWLVKNVRFLVNLGNSWWNLVLARPRHGLVKPTWSPCRNSTRNPSCSMKATFTPSNGTNGQAKTFEASYFAAPPHIPNALTGVRGPLLETRQARRLQRTHSDGKLKPFLKRQRTRTTLAQRVAHFLVSFLGGVSSPYSTHGKGKKVRANGDLWCETGSKRF